jgi:hypothetical protein
MKSPTLLKTAITAQRRLTMFFKKLIKALWGRMNPPLKLNYGEHYGLSLNVTKEGAPYFLYSSDGIFTALKGKPTEDPKNGKYVPDFLRGKLCLCKETNKVSDSLTCLAKAYYRRGETPPKCHWPEEHPEKL